MPLAPQLCRSAKNCPSAHGLKKRTRQLPEVPDQSYNQQRTLRRSGEEIQSDCWWQSSGWGTRGVSPGHPNVSKTQQTGCMRMTELQEAAGACSGDQQSPPTLTPHSRTSVSGTETRGGTSRNNCISQILPGATLHTGFSQKCSDSQNKSSHSSGSAGGDLSIPALRAAGWCLPTPFPLQFLLFLITFKCWWEAKPVVIRGFVSDERLSFCLRKAAKS